MIHARGLVQTFKTRDGRKKTEVRAVDGVDLDVAEGEVVGFLGPNGAGKTTTLRMLTTLLRPTAGDGDGRRVRRRQAVRAGPAPHRLRVTGRRRLQRRTGRRRGGRPRDALRDEGLPRRPTHAARSCSASSTSTGLWTRMPKNMSGGQRRRLDIVMGLIHEPTLVFLDEPTTGLDPQARANLWEHIADLRRRRGATVFLTTHYLDEADALSDRIVIIDHGQDRRGRHRRTTSRPRSRATSSTSRSADPDLGGRRRPAPRGRSPRPPRHGLQGVEIDGNHVRGRVQRAGKAVPGLLRDLHDADISLGLHRGAPPDPGRRVPHPDGRSLRDAEPNRPRGSPARPREGELTCVSCASVTSSSAASCG